MGNLERWHAEFPGEQLWVGFTHEVRTRPEWLLGEVFRHLGVSTEVDWSLFPTRSDVNTRGKVPMPEEYRKYLTELYSGQIEQLQRVYGQASGPLAESGAVHRSVRFGGRTRA